MLHILTFALAAALHAQVETQTASARDSAESVRDSIRRARREQHHEHHSSVLRARKTRTPLTATLLANAYPDMRRRAGALAAPPLDEAGQAFLEVHSRLEAAAFVTHSGMLSNLIRSDGVRAGADGTSGDGHRQPEDVLGRG